MKTNRITKIPYWIDHRLEWADRVGSGTVYVLKDNIPFVRKLLADKRYEYFQVWQLRV